MGKMKDFWFINYETAQELFLDGDIDEQGYTQLMTDLGFDPVEIDNHLSEMGE